MDECELVEVKLFRSRFTWTRGKGRDTIMEKLDMGLAMQKWFKQFSYSSVKTLVAAISNHVPLLFNISDQKQHDFYKARKFKFENMLLENKDCHKVVKQSWTTTVFIISRILLKQWKHVVEHGCNGIKRSIGIYR